LNDGIPPEVVELLRGRIDSFEKLELVVALHRAPAQTISVEAASRQLHLPRDVVRQVVQELRAASLVFHGRNGEIQLLPPTERDRTSLLALVRTYDENRLAIVKTLNAKAMDRIRDLATFAFTDRGSDET